MKTWAKTILNIYRYLERVSNAIDKIVISRATNSFYTSGSNLSFNDIGNVSNDILNLTERKIILINLRIIIENALVNTNKDYVKYLILNFVEKRSCYESARILNVSLRTYFRKLNLALTSFEKALIRNGYDIEYFEQKLSNESWIMEVKNKIQLQKNEMESFELSGKIAKKITLNYKSDNSHKKDSNLQVHNSLSF